MNPEIYDVLRQIGEYEPLDRQARLSYLMSQLQVLLAEESEKSTKKIKNLTIVLIAFTIIIAILTGILALPLFYEFPKAIVKNDNQKYFYTPKKDKINNDPHIKNFPERSKEGPNINR